MKCQLCKELKDIKEFDTAVEHLVMVMSIHGTVHVHGPFSNEYVMRKMADAFMAELEKNGIKYEPPTQHRIGD
jgi:hypothetical protein